MSSIITFSSKNIAVESINIYDSQYNIDSELYGNTDTIATRTSMLRFKLLVSVLVLI
ncbi:hypothetical protein F444_22972 [Phytophthora nicotianae P1976]|uniref:Uncharacterized protein n=1 Tax=Phytophthora nicotianae P1976 TaxID=1317066 RepID=A0A080YW87_PHYNI|nr:hypothetical protein F444_22972 [Phytophthora nicotianae P1976]